MYCAGCGQVLSSQQTVCPRCGRTGNPASDAVEVYAFAQTVRRLSHYWFLFVCLSVALGAAGAVLFHAGLLHHMAPWEPWPHPPLMVWTCQYSTWALWTSRLALAAAACIGLRRRAIWARWVTMAAAALALTEFPIGLLLGAYTLVKLMGNRNAKLFARLS